MRGLWKLTWLEIKIFLREPLGAIGTLLFPILIFILLGKLGGGRISAPDKSVPSFIGPDLPIFVSILISLGAVLSLATIVAIYREGGILKRLRATPMRPYTILTAHVVVKLLFALATLLALIAAGKRVFPAQLNAPILSFSLAVLFSTLSILSIGFVLASLIPTARFVQPVGALAVLSDDRLVRPLLSGRGAAADAAAHGSRAAADLRGVADERHVARRKLARARR